MNSLTYGAESSDVVEPSSGDMTASFADIVWASLFGRNLTPSDGGLFS